MYFNQLLHSTDHLTWIVFGILAVAFIIQAYYYLFVFGAFNSFSKNKSSSKEQVSEMETAEKERGISVIICAKNEAQNLSKYLPAFLEQNYENYEVVVVNDCSTDNTEDILMDMKVHFPHLRYTSIPLDKKFRHGKKLAVTVGIKSAKNDCMLFSDADCYPETDQWIRKMAANFNKDTEVVLGIGKYSRRRGLLNYIVRYETLFTAMQYISFAIKGYPYMGVGRNLAYTKDLFYRKKGFASHLKVLSGDDDLFVNEAANALNTRVEISEESYTVSVPPSSFKEWFQQKKRHLSTGKYYKTSSKFRLATEYISRLSFFAAFLTLLFNPLWLWISLSAWFVLFIIKSITIMNFMKKLNEKDLFLSSFILDLLLPIFLFIIKASNIVRPREPKWS